MDTSVETLMADPLDLLGCGFFHLCFGCESKKQDKLAGLLLIEVLSKATNPSSAEESGGYPNFTLGIVSFNSLFSFYFSKS
jgi:hypothetical protein